MNKNEDEDVAFQILIAIKLKKLEMNLTGERSSQDKYLLKTTFLLG